MNSSTIPNGSITTNITTTTVVTTTTVAMPTVTRFFDSADGRTVLAFLVIIFLLLLALPIAAYVIVRRFCWIKVHSTGQGEWSSRGRPSAKDRDKKVQTDVTGAELDDFFRRRQPTDMRTYNGKTLPTIEPTARWHTLNPQKWNDPWVSKFPKQPSYIDKLV